MFCQTYYKLYHCEDMDIPECKELKKKYDDCFGSWFKNIQKVEPIQCETVFQDYKDCVVLVMQSRSKNNGTKKQGNWTKKIIWNTKL